jgi:hypothetical protein
MADVMVQCAEVQQIVDALRNDDKGPLADRIAVVTADANLNETFWISEEEPAGRITKTTKRPAKRKVTKKKVTKKKATKGRKR